MLSSPTNTANFTPSILFYKPNAMTHFMINGVNYKNRNNPIKNSHG